MALLLAWVSLGSCLLLLVVCAILYLDAKGAREDLASWRLSTEVRLASYAARLAAIEGGPPSPGPAAAVARSAEGASPPEPKSDPRPLLVACAEDDSGRAAMLPGGVDDRRKTMIGVAPAMPAAPLPGENAAPTTSVGKAARSP
jgi:hypothetical protein